MTKEKLIRVNRARAERPRPSPAVVAGFILAYEEAHPSGAQTAAWEGERRRRGRRETSETSETEANRDAGNV